MRPLITIFVLLTFLTGVAYPLFVTAAAAVFFPRQAEGSLIERKGVIVGSELIGQSFAGDRYFWSRPSATAPAPYNAAASSGSNLGPTNPALIKTVHERVEVLVALSGGTKKVPIDLVTASASGLDPHISLASAEYQVNRISQKRGLSPQKIRELINNYSEGRFLGIFGEARVNVLRLNLALDEIS